MENWVQVLIIISVYCVIVLAVGVFSREKGAPSLEAPNRPIDHQKTEQPKDTIENLLGFSCF